MTHATASAPTPRIARKRELKAEAILDAATAVLEAEGLEGLTLGRVATALELVPGALYRYYASKDALLAGLQRRAVAEIGEVLQRSLERLDPTLPEPVLCLARLLAFAHAYAELPRKAPQAWHLVGLMLAEPKPLLSASEAARTAPMLGGLLLSVRDALDRAAELKAVSRGDAAARTVAYWGALHGAASLGKLRLWSKELPETQTVSVLAATSLLSGWGAKPALVEQARRLAARGAAR